MASRLPGRPRSRSPDGGRPLARSASVTFGAAAQRVPPVVDGLVARVDQLTNMMQTLMQVQQGFQQTVAQQFQQVQQVQQGSVPASACGSTGFPMPPPGIPPLPQRVQGSPGVTSTGNVPIGVTGSPEPTGFFEFPGTSQVPQPASSETLESPWMLTLEII